MADSSSSASSVRAEAERLLQEREERVLRCADRHQHGYGCPYDGDVVFQPKPGDCTCGDEPCSACTKELRVISTIRDLLALLTEREQQIQHSPPTRVGSSSSADVIHERARKLLADLEGDGYDELEQGREFEIYVTEVIADLLSALEAEKKELAEMRLQAEQVAVRLQRQIDAREAAEAALEKWRSEATRTR